MYRYLAPSSSKRYLRPRHRWGVAATAALLASAPLLSAQVVGGTIAGAVTDATGAVVANASVLVHNQNTGTERHLRTDAAGEFSAPSIPVGIYAVTVDAAGFATLKRTGIDLAIGQALRVPLVLSLANATEQVTVADTPAAVNLSTQQTAGLVDERQVKQLPLNGRSYDQLLTLNPGIVNYTAQRSGSVGTANSAVGNMFTVSGRRPQDNLYLLNGVEYTGASLINLTPGGTSGQLLGVDAVREFNVVYDTYGATYGKRQGAQVSIVTDAGTNQLHGAAYEFLRNSALDARNYFDQARIPEFQRNDFGASLGGPLKQNKLFLFGNYEGYRQKLGITDVTLVPDAEARLGSLPNAAGVETKVPLGPGVASLFNLWPQQNGPELLNASGTPTGIAEAFSSPTQHIREDFGTTRFDSNLSTNDLLFAVYTVDDSAANTPTQNPLSLIDEALREQVLSVQEQHVFSSHLLNTARFGFSRASFVFNGSVPADVQAETPTFLAGKPTGAIVIAGSTASNGSSQVTGAGANVGSENATSRNLFTVDDHVYYTSGKHQIEAGGWLQRMQSNDALAQDQFGQASFASLSTFLAGTIKTFTVVPQPTELGWRALFGAAYVQDTYKVTPRLELSAGLRTESTNGWNEAQGRASVYGFTNGILNTTPSVGAAALTDNRAKFLPEPRVAFAWDVTGKGTTAVRASFGLHHSLLDNLDYRLDQAAPFNTTLTYSGVPVSAPTSGAVGLPSPSNVSPNLETPAVLAWTFKVEQQLAPALALTVGYVGSHGYHQILSEDENEPASLVCSDESLTVCPAGVSAGTIYYPTTAKANPSLANTTSWISTGISNYNALEVDLRRSFANGLQLRGNYTFSKNLDDGSAWNTSVSANTPAYVEYPDNAKLDYGLAATDVRNLFAFHGSYDVPLGTGARYLQDLSPLPNKVVSGWTVSSIVNLQTGFPFSPQLGYNPTGSGDTRNPVRPNRSPTFTSNLYTHGSTAARAAHFFNADAFSAPAYGTVGTLGRDTLEGPGYSEWDFSLLKNISVSERVHVQFRSEFFNILNHANLQTPNEVVYSSGPTQGAAASQDAAAVGSPTAGVVTAASASRQIQFGLKVLF